MIRFVFILFNGDDMKNIILGFVIGIAAITPGLSGGVIAASLGIYERIITAVCDLRKNFRYNFSYLLPFGIGGIAGAILFGRVTENLIRYSYYEVMFIFTGLVLGTIPDLIKEANFGGFKLFYLVPCAASFLMCIFSGNVFSKAVNGIDSVCIQLVLTGFVLSIGTIIPGLSSSFILMKAGLYNLYIGSVSELNILNLFFILLGFILTTLIMIRIIKVMFEKFHGVSYYSVLGFLIGSIIMVFPGVREIRKAAVDFSLMYLSGLMSFLVMSFKKSC